LHEKSGIICTFVGRKGAFYIINQKKMKLKIVIFTLLATAGLFGAATAQELKIGHANIDLIISLMPETQTMQTQLQTFQKKLGEQLKVKEEYAQGKYVDYLGKKDGGASEEDLKPLEDELLKLDGEIRQYTAESEEKLVQKRQTLMAPIVEKLQASIETLAKEEGYTYILNSVDGSGVSVVLHGPEQSNVTEKLAKRMGLELPKEATDPQN
jgi:outer membrane protein